MPEHTEEERRKNREKERKEKARKRRERESAAKKLTGKGEARKAAEKIQDHRERTDKRARQILLQTR